ncbi:MAG: hypothetical protein IT259_07580 [Saprospiraceae bacterium]|nr:hypothetical protein [Saprospiraceae bacterium]
MPGVKKSEKVPLHTNRVYQALCHLESGEIKRLAKYLQSPYFNQSKTLSKLFELLLRSVEEQKEGFDRHEVWKKMFQGEPYDDTNFRKYCSDLLKLVENFMAHETLERDETRQRINTLEFVVKDKIEPLYNSVLRQARNHVDANSYRNLYYFYNAYLIERQYYAMSDFDVRLYVRPNIEEISYNLDIFYWIEKLKIQIAVLSQKKTRSHEYAVNFMEEIIAFLQKFPLDSIPELSLYYYSFLTLYDEGNLNNYYKLRSLLDEYGNDMPQKEAVELYDLALHYCTGKLNQGDRVFLQEYFDVFDEAMLRKIFILNGELASWRFNNAIGVALRLGKMDWAEKFITTYKENLPAQTRENTSSFSLSRVYLYQKRYKDVLRILQNVDYEDIGYNLISKAVLIITYYELDEVDALDSFLESFRVFLNRHKNIPAQRRKSYLNLIKYVRRLTRLLPNDQAGITRLREEIIREKASTVNHEWLLEKLAELDG